MRGNPEKFYNRNGVFTSEEMHDPAKRFESLFVLNIVYMLLTSGIDGIRLGFWNNDAFKGVYGEDAGDPGRGFRDDMTSYHDQQAGTVFFCAE